MTQADKTLLDEALKVRDKAHAPYSGYHVGVALMDDKGRMHLGCNVENASFPEGICAEANAIGAMVSQGGKRIATIAVVGGMGDSTIAAAGGNVESCTPCGGCRQRILEFADSDTRILLRDAQGETQSYAIEELLPAAFRVV